MTNPVVWKSTKLDRVCSSTLAAESLALHKAVDHALFIQKTLKVLQGEHVPVVIECFVDNKGVLELVQKTKDPTERRLICIMSELREMVEKSEITINFIPSKKMPADVLTKKGKNGDIIRMCLTSE